MLVVKSRNPIVATIMKPFYITDGAYDADYIESFVHSRLTHFKENSLAVLVFDGLELVGFTFSWIPDTRQFVRIEQAWAKSGLDKKYVKANIDRVEEFAVDNGINDILIVTDRPRAMKRRFGFKTHATVLKRSIEG